MDKVVESENEHEDVNEDANEGINKVSKLTSN